MEKTILPAAHDRSNQSEIVNDVPDLTPVNFPPFEVTDLFSQVRRRDRILGADATAQD